MDLKRIEEFMQRVEESETHTGTPVSDKLKVGVDLGTAYIVLVVLDEENNRQAKGNDSYYLLKKTAKPIVIVECGFLSNRQEAEKLITPIYQERVAFQIHMGIMKYINALY